MDIKPATTAVDTGQQPNRTVAKKDKQCTGIFSEITNIRYTNHICTVERDLFIYLPYAMKPTVRFPQAPHQFDLVAGRKREILPASTFKVFNVERLLHIVYSLCYKKIQHLFSRTGVAVLNLAGDVRPPAHLFSKNVWYINYKQRRQHTKKAWNCRHYPAHRHPHATHVDNKQQPTPD